jgi:hypothetical protein
VTFSGRLGRDLSLLGVERAHLSDKRGPNESLSSSIVLYSEIESVVMTIS